MGYMEKVYEMTLPIATLSEANTREHWAKAYKRHRVQKNYIRWAWLEYKPLICLPCHIVLTRYGNKMDNDNLMCAFKYIRDAIADQIKPGFAPGRADEGSDITWEYKQVGKRQRKIMIEVYF